MMKDLLAAASSHDDYMWTTSLSPFDPQGDARLARLPSSQPLPLRFFCLESIIL
jgi:hypothetical protein